MPSLETLPLFAPHHHAAIGSAAIATRSAAADVTLTLSERRKAVLMALRESGAIGMTADEIASKLNLSVLSIRPRVSELAKAGVIRSRDDERRRNASGKMAAVWVTV